MEKTIYQLNISNIWDPTNNKDFWEANIEVPDDCSLFELHQFIQQILDFDNDHLYKFFAGRNELNNKIEFSEKPGYPSDGGDYMVVLLKNIYPLKGLKLYYLFDFGDNWVFEIRRSRKKIKLLQNTKYPRIVSDNGIKLMQYYFYDDEDE